MGVLAEHRTFGGFGDRSGANSLLFAGLNASFRTLSMQRLPGFRDYYPEDCAFRNYLFENWRRVARSFGFQEYDGPTLEPTELYKKKSGEELKTQLFRFVDQGDRDVCMKPEMTPTLARLIAARERDFRKPIKWFSISPFFRFEKPQKGRLREFYQINCDIVGDDSPAADAELHRACHRLASSFRSDRGRLFRSSQQSQSLGRFPDQASKANRTNCPSFFPLSINLNVRDEEITNA